MRILRILALLLTAPIWLVAGVLIACVCVPLFVVSFFVAMCEYGFTGEWDWII